MKNAILLKLSFSIWLYCVNLQTHLLLSISKLVSLNLLQNLAHLIKNLFTFTPAPPLLPPSPSPDTFTIISCKSYKDYQVLYYCLTQVKWIHHPCPQQIFRFIKNGHLQFFVFQKVWYIGVTKSIKLKNFFVRFLFYGYWKFVMSQR